MYRDEYERCPRDGVELVESGAVRGCSQCSGQWVTADTLVEMAQVMTQPNQPRIRFWRHQRAAIACPTCTQPMATWKFHQVEIDRCEPHGIWFDAGELERVLLGVFEEDQHPRLRRTPTLGVLASRRCGESP